MIANKLQTQVSKSASLLQRACRTFSNRKNNPFKSLSISSEIE